jgi:hypothetical protein
MTKPPAMCGFFRMTAAMWQTREDRRITVALRQFTAHRNHRFGGVFAEDEQFPRLGAWDNLVTRCRAGAYDVVVPALAHLDPSPVLAAHIRDDLAQEIGGTVWVVAEHMQQAAS